MWPWNSRSDSTKWVCLSPSVKNSGVLALFSCLIQVLLYLSFKHVLRLYGEEQPVISFFKKNSYCFRKHPPQKIGRESNWQQTWSRDLGMPPSRKPTIANRTTGKLYIPDPSTLTKPREQNSRSLVPIRWFRLLISWRRSWLTLVSSLEMMSSQWEEVYLKIYKQLEDSPRGWELPLNCGSCQLLTNSKINHCVACRWSRICGF